MEKLRGTSLYCGINVTLEEMKAHLTEAHKAGINAVFTSLQLPESDPKVLLHDFPLMCAEAHAYGMKVAADVAGRTAQKFGLDLHDAKLMKDFGVDILRLDGGYTIEQTAEITHNPHGLTIMLNASSHEEKIQELVECGINKEQVLFCHNYYPMRYSGLQPSCAIKNNKMLHKYGFRVAGFLASQTHKRLACGIGLPTIETLRHVPVRSAAQQALFYGMDDLFFGDDLASYEEMKILCETELPMKFRMKMLVDDAELEAWFKGREIPQLQGNIPEIVRSLAYREGVLYRGNCEVGLSGPRKKGTVMLAKKALYRYAGEVQIARCDLPDDPDIGIIGQIIDEDLPLLDIFKVDENVFVGPSFQFEIVK